MQKSQFQSFRPLTAVIAETFRETIAGMGGSVQNRYDDGQRLFLRAVLPGLAGEVKAGDGMRGGVALRTSGPEVLVHPYSYRLVCRNGAIHARAEGTFRVERVAPGAGDEEAWTALREIEEAVRSAACPETFRSNLDDARTAVRAEADQVLAILPALLEGRFPGSEMLVARFLEEIHRRYHREEERSLYGLMNAVTSVARDTREPEARYRLEELGGGVLAFLKAPRPATPAKRALAIPV